MNDTARNHFERAAQLLSWGNSAIADMTQQGCRGNIDEVDRHFYSLLAIVSSLHDVLKAKAGKGDWRKAFDDVRSNDPLLRYLWLARNSEHHDALLKWGKEALEFKFSVVDERKFHMVTAGFRETCQYHGQADKLERLMTHLFGVASMDGLTKLGTTAAPLPERVESAGIEIEGFAHTLYLRPFETRDYGLIEAPLMHLGSPIGPSAINAGSLALNFYKQKLDELKLLRPS